MGFAFAVCQGCASWFRRSVASQSGQSSREAPGPSIHGRVRFASPLRMSIWKFQSETRMRSRFLKERVARTSRECRCSFCIPLNGDWSHLDISYAFAMSVQSWHSANRCPMQVVAMLAQIIANVQGPLFVPESAQTLPSPRHHRIRILVCPPMRTNGESSLEKRRGVRALTARQSHQSFRGQRLKFERKRLFHLVQTSKLAMPQVSSERLLCRGFPYHNVSQLLAAVMARWPSFSRFGASE